MQHDWIAMRGSLMQSPKLIAMARILHESRDFRDWLLPGGGGPCNGQLISDSALRCVTCALLLRVWSAAREFGKWVGDDLHLEHITLRDVDAMASAPGVGVAMEAVGWAIEGDGVTLPKFKQHNVAKTNADRQREWREKHKQAVTEPLHDRYNKTVTTGQDRTGQLSPVPVPGPASGNGLEGHPGQTGSGYRPAKAGSLAAVTAGLLADTGQLWRWFEAQARTGPKLLPRTDAGWQTCVAAAEQALTGTKPAAWFVKILKQRQTDQITSEAKARGLARITAFNAELAERAKSGKAANCAKLPAATREAEQPAEAAT